MPTPVRSAWDGVDSATESFLFKMALEEEEEEEEEGAGEAAAHEEEEEE